MTATANDDGEPTADGARLRSSTAAAGGPLSPEFQGAGGWGAAVAWASGLGSAGVLVPAAFVARGERDRLAVRGFSVTAAGDGDGGWWGGKKSNAGGPWVRISW